MKTFLITGKTQGVFVEHRTDALNKDHAKDIGKVLGLKSIKVKEIKN